MSKPRKRIRAKPSRERSCTGKQKFTDLEAAGAAARRPRHMLQAGGFMAPYRCRFCSSFHYGHPPQK